MVVTCFPMLPSLLTPGVDVGSDKRPSRNEGQDISRRTKHENWNRFPYQESA